MTISTFVTVLLLHHIRISSSTEDCFCVPMDKKELTNGTKPLFTQALKILNDCGNIGRKTCLSLCRSLAIIAQYDPRSAKSFCFQVRQNISNVYVSKNSKLLFPPSKLKILSYMCGNSAFFGMVFYTQHYAEEDRITTEVSVFGKACDGDYEYTGLTFNKPICCNNKEPIPCLKEI